MSPAIKKYWKARDGFYEPELPASPTPQVTFLHCFAGIHVGRMDPKPLIEEFDVVVTLAAEPGAVDDGIKHHHVPVSYINPDWELLQGAGLYAAHAVRTDKKLLVRSEGGRNRPGTVVAIAVLELGGNYLDAVIAIQNHGMPLADDFRFRNAVAAHAERLGRR